MVVKTYTITLNDNISMDDNVIPFLRKLLCNYVDTLFIKNRENETYTIKWDICRYETLSLNTFPKRKFMKKIYAIGIGSFMIMDQLLFVN
jgi:hypothetical protein